MRYGVRLVLVCGIVAALVLLWGVTYYSFGYCTAPICGELRTPIFVA